MQLAENSSSAMMLTKQLLYQIDGISLDQAIESAVQVNTIARMTEDFKQGLGHFLDRKKQ